jgi:hypothetical protein
MRRRNYAELPETIEVSSIRQVNRQWINKFTSDVPASGKTSQFFHILSSETTAI